MNGCRLVVSELNVKPHSNTRAHSRTHHQDHLTGHANTRSYTHTQLRLPLALRLTSAHMPTPQPPQRHRKSKGDPFLPEVLFCLVFAQMTRVQRKYTAYIETRAATFITDLNDLQSPRNSNLINIPLNQLCLYTHFYMVDSKHDQVLLYRRMDALYLK